jgi:hypothetical protein
VSRGLAVAAAAALVAAAPRADAAEVGLYVLPAGGRVRAVRAVDVDGDGRRDLVLLVARASGDDGVRNEVVVLRTPAKPVAKTFFDPAAALRIPCDGDAAGARATAGAVAVGRFGPKGEVRLRFLGPGGLAEVGADGAPAPAEEGREPVAGTSLVREAGADLVFWDAVGDLDADGREECWFPDAEGRMIVRGGAAGSDWILGFPAARELASDESSAFVRRTVVPSLVPADFDGDGRLDLGHLGRAELVVWSRGAAGPRRVALPFLEAAPDLPREEIRAARVQVADVDRDGKADLLATMVQGRADKVGGLRTSLYHYAGPVLGPTGSLSPPRTRIDTESVALHPRFRDVDGDGRLDYVADSIRGNLFDLIQRVMGKEPEITYTAYRFDPARGTFEGSPYATFERPYSASEARGNRFGQSGWFDGDFDRDGHADFLDLGNLTGVEVLRGVRGASVASGGKASFDVPLVRRVRVPKALASDALVVDLDGDRASDAVLWAEDTLYLVVPR